jgi:chromosome segregation ATPase
MKYKVSIVILILVSLALGVSLVRQQRESVRKTSELQDQISYHSNQVVQESARLEKQNQANSKLLGDLETRASELKTLSNNLGKVIVDLEKSDAQAKATAEQLRTAQAELAKKDQKINELESERSALGKQMDQLTNSIGDLEKLIAATEKKLVTEKGEKAFLVKELTRLRAEKSELERQFNDLAVMRVQVSKLKEELAISRRLEFIRLNLFGSTGKGGAQKLMTPASQPSPAASPGTNYGLEVELRPDGGAKVVPPAPAPVPAPAPPQ